MDSTNSSEAPLLYVSHVKKYFDITSLFRNVGKVRAVDDVTFKLNSGETLGLLAKPGAVKQPLAGPFCSLFPLLKVIFILTLTHLL
jgi:ABC-type oligopeptide transport system, ATPase component